MILSLDTTREFGSVAIHSGEELIEEIPLHEREGFGHVIYGILAGLLERHGLSVDVFECFAAASGPGSFTGVRVGLACIKGLGEATGKPVVSVSNLAAIAWFGRAELRAPVLDARRGEIYGGLYTAAGEAVAPEVVAPFPRWVASLPAGAEIISTDPQLFPPAVGAPRALASAIGHIAYRRLRQGLAQDPAAVDANYVRHSDAELFWKDA